MCRDDFEWHFYFGVVNIVIEEKYLLRGRVQCDDEVIYDGFHTRLIVHLLENHCHDGVRIFFSLLPMDLNSFL